MHYNHYNRYFIIPFILLLGCFNLLDAKSSRYRCMWNNDPSTTMVIGWDQLSGSQPVVYYDNYDGGRDFNNYSRKQFPDRVIKAKGMNNHFVRLTGLFPNTEYYFIVVDSEGVSNRYSFKTAPDNAGERLSIISGGDSRNHRTARRAANKIVSRLRPHVVTFGGDMTGGDTGREWKDWFDDWQHTICNDGHITPIIVARGNHEFSNKTLIDVFDVKHPSIYYALTLGGDLLRIYTLNTLIASGGEQRDWLQYDLENNQHCAWRMAQYHYAIRPHTSKKAERNDQLKNWATLFQKHAVHLVVESDIHCVKSTYPIIPFSGPGSDEGFIRDDEKGTVYVGEGCWGAPLRKNNDDKEWTRNSGSFNQIKWIFVDYNNIEVRTIMVDNADEVASVFKDDIFTMPAGLKLWQPSNGAVITIPRRSHFGPVTSAPTHVPRNIKPLSVSDFVAIANPDGLHELKWSSTNENAQTVYEVQRCSNDEQFITIAQVRANATSRDYVCSSYEIKDVLPATSINQVKYRIRCALPSGKSNIFNCDNYVVTTPNEWGQFKQLKPDVTSGLLRVKYSLQNPDDVVIRLINPSNEVMTKSEYKNQKAGNYLQSIDMNKLPKGTYLLIIKTENGGTSKFKVDWV